MTEAIGLRQKKKARIKLRIVGVVSEWVKEKAFDAILIEEICGQVGISKVTFFKYFPQKEDILAYLMRVWCYRRTVERNCMQIKGVAAIYRLFNEATREAKEYAKSRLLPVSLVAYLAKIQQRPEMNDLDTAEKSLLFPDQPEYWEVPLQTLDQLLLEDLKDAVSLGEVDPGFDLIRLTKHLISIFYGAPIAALIFQERDIASYYRMHLDDIFRKNA